MRHILKDVLTQDAFKVIVARNAREGLALYNKEQGMIETVILDFNLPDQNGLVTFNQLKEINPVVKVILTSGFDVDESVEQALNDGALQFVRKPFNRQQILEAVKKVYSYRVNS
ncbi:MAG: response regulator [Calditrichia bacterium]